MSRNVQGLRAGRGNSVIRYSYLKGLSLGLSFQDESASKSTPHTHTTGTTLASSVRAEYEAAAAALDARTAAWYVRTGTAAPVGAPTAVDILASFPPVRGLVFGSTACGGSREVGILLAQAASSSAQRQWRSLGARSMLDARSFMISTLRSQVGFAAAVAHARLRLSRLELIGGSGRTAGRYASAARAFISPTGPSSRRGEALWERAEAGSGLLGAASSESAAGSGRLRACGC